MHCSPVSISFFPTQSTWFRFWLCAALMAIVSPAVKAQKPTQIFGQAFQRFTHRNIEGVKAELLTTDSTAIDSMTTGPGFDIDQRQVWYFNLDKYNGEGPYIIRLSAPGYETHYINIPALNKGSGFHDMGNCELRVKPKTHALGEATVTATKIKFYHNGDTLVYNADAFNLSKGSMLDDLIRKLPGARITENGEIFVNGRKVQSLLLNGRNFFDGNKQLMLDNLPSYMVHRVQVFERKQLSAMASQSADNAELVMNVKLKKEYNAGWMGNADVGGGSHDRYLARFFSMRFTDKSQLAIVANMNNLNDTRKPGKDTGWSPDRMPQGAMSTKLAAIDYNYKNDYTRVIYSGNFEARHSTSNELNDQVGEQFLASGNTFTRRIAQSHTGITQAQTHHNFEKRGQDYGLILKLDAEFQHSRLRGTDVAATFAADPQPLLTDGASMLDILKSTGTNRAHLLDSLAINRTLIQQRLTQSQGKGTFEADFGYKDLEASAYVGMALSSDKDFQHYLLDYPAGSTPSDFRNRYAHTSPNSSVSYTFDSKYHFYLPRKVRLTTQYAFTQSLDNKSYALHRLDRLEGWGEQETPDLGMLPSTAEWLRSETLDDENSFRYLYRPITQDFSLNLRKHWIQNDSMELRAFVYLLTEWQRQRLDYTRHTYSKVTKRNDVSFIPTFQLYYHFYKPQQKLLQTELTYKINQTPPDVLDHLLELPNTSDPLNIRTGNAQLHRTTDQQLSLTFKFSNAAKMRSINLNGELQSWRNAIAQGFTYNTATGVRTYKPQNVNGNLKASFDSDYYLPLDHKRKVYFWGNSSFLYHRNVDLIGFEGEQTQAQESRVNNWEATQSLKLLWYACNPFSIQFVGSATMNRATFLRLTFANQTVWAFQYGAEFVVRLPHDFNISSDVKVYANRGWKDAQGNTTDLVWNASVWHTFKRSGISISIDGFDILHQLSSRTFAMNSQGRTEIYRNTLPSYFVAHIVWKFSKKPKE